MLNIIFLLFNLGLCAYYTTQKNYAILAYLILFQEIHLIPFNNLGLNGLGYIYYLFISVTFLIHTTDFKLTKRRIKYVISNYVFISLAILSFTILFHAFIIGLKSEGAQTLTLRYFLQVLPAIAFLILVLERKKILDQLAYGILIFGVLLILIVLTTTDVFSMTSARSGFRDEIGISPIALSRNGAIMMITSLFLLMDNALNKYKVPIFIISLVSLFIMILGMSRGPLLALILSLASYYILKKGSIGVKIFKFSLVILISISAGMFLYNYLNIELLDQYYARIEGLQHYENMGRYHRYIWAAEFINTNFGLSSNYFWIGMGPAGFAFYSGMGYAHNLIVESVLEYGFFGIIFITMFTLSSFYYTIKIIQTDKNIKYMYIPVIFIFLYIASMVSGDLIGSRNLFFIAIIQITYFYYMKKSVKMMPMNPELVRSVVSH